MKSSRRTKEEFRRLYGYLEEVGLVAPLREIVSAHHVTLLEIYIDSRTPASHAARLEVWWTLVHVYGRSMAETSRMFDRDYSSVFHAMKSLREQALAHEVALVGDTVRALAKLVAGSAPGAPRTRQAARTTQPQGGAPKVAPRGAQEQDDDPRGCR